MHFPPSVTLISYYKSFKSISGLLATATGVGPLVSVLIPGGASAYFFPALGDTTMPSRLGVVALSVAVTYFAFYSTPPTKGVFRRFLVLAVGALLALCFYLFSFSHFVRKIDVPASESSIFVGVGYDLNYAYTPASPRGAAWISDFIVVAAWYLDR